MKLCQFLLPGRASRATHAGDGLNSLDKYAMRRWKVAGMVPWLNFHITKVWTSIASANVLQKQAVTEVWSVIVFMNVTAIVCGTSVTVFVV